MHRPSRPAALAALLLAGAGAAVAAQRAPSPLPATEPTWQTLAAGPPEPVALQDPADSLYREARSMVNRANYTRAAYLFGQIYDRYPRSAYAPDAFYWEAFALSRTNSTASLNRALAALRQQAERHPNAATRRDADNLAARIRGQLARRGDVEAAREVEEMARSLEQVAADRARVEADRARAASDQARTAAQRGRAQRNACRDEDEERIAALNALLQMDSDRALPILERVMARRDQGSTCLRRRAVFMISQHGDPRAASLLLDAVRSDPDAEVREQAVFWLSQVDSERAVAALDSILRASTDPNIQEKAIFALSQHGSQRAAQALREFAGRAGAPANLRENAIFWLGQGGRAEHTEFLRTLYGTVREEGLKEKIIFSLAQGGGRDAGRWLLDIAANQNESIRLRKNAIFWAAQTGADLPGLFTLYDRAGDREIKEQLIFAYSQNGRREAIDKLIEIARRDQDRELRKKALFWLAQSKDPRVVELLAEILEKPDR